MTKTFLLTILGLILGACASKRDIASTQENRETQEQVQHAQMVDGQASRIR